MSPRKKGKSLTVLATKIKCMDIATPYYFYISKNIFLIILWINFHSIIPMYYRVCKQRRHHIVTLLFFQVYILPDLFVKSFHCPEVADILLRHNYIYQNRLDLYNLRKTKQYYCSSYFCVCLQINHNIIWSTRLLCKSKVLLWDTRYLVYVLRPSFGIPWSKNPNYPLNK